MVVRGEAALPSQTVIYSESINQVWELRGGGLGCPDGGLLPPQGGNTGFGYGCDLHGYNMEGAFEVSLFCVRVHWD